MFDIPRSLLTFWQSREAELRAAGQAGFARMGPADFARIEALWGQPLPEAYKRFQSDFGAVEFPDSCCAFDCVYQHGDGPRHVHGAVLRSVTPLQTLELNHRHLIEDPDNETEEPFFPPFFLPFGSDAGTNIILLELGTDSPRVWFWEDQNDAFGRGSNLVLGYVAPSLEQFVASLKPYE